MILRKLSKEQISAVYKDRMVIDFPPSELKPLSIILDAVDKGIYEGLGLYDGDRIVGYSYLVKQSADYLIDYLAIYPERRNGGVGSTLVKLLSEYMGDAGSIIVEVEDPEYAKNEEDRKIRIRRLNFYLRNGCCDTGVRVRCFGVEFVILSVGKLKSDKDSCWELYTSFYKEVLPKDLYTDKIEFLGYTNG